MPEHRPRFPFQDDDVSEDEPYAPFSMMSLNPPANDPGLSIGVRSFVLHDDNAGNDEFVSTLMPLNSQINDPTAPLLSPLKATHTYKQETRSQTWWADFFFETERILSQHGHLSTPVPVQIPATRLAHRPSGQPAPNDEPPYPNQPANWDEHHEYFLWACRGAVPIITDHLQAIFQFSPPLLQSFVRAKLNNNAKRQIEFLQTYLPGEFHSMQRAEARIVLWEAGINDPEAQEGSQRMDIPQFCPTDNRYARPRMPRGQPPFTDWVRMHDSYLLSFLGH